MSKRKKKTGEKNLNRKSLTNSILAIFRNKPSGTFNYKQISGQLMIKESNARKMVFDILRNLAHENILEEVHTGKFRLKSKTGYINGIVDITISGYGFVISEDIEEDIFVSQNNLHHALHGDFVKVFLYAKRKGKNTEGEVVEIIQRKKTSFVGILELAKNFAFLIPDDKYMPYHLYIPLEKLNGALNGQKVIGEITDWPEHAKNPFGKITAVLGFPGNNEAEMHAILAEFELPYQFPDNVLNEAENIKDIITEDELTNREDFRDVPTMTIDPVDAKDFDDALSIKKLENNHWEIGVHIADVTHYVKPKTLLDQEAFERGTSVYLVDRVVPMLPERLSNQICSLRPKEDKLSFSAIFELNDQAEIINQRFKKTIIFSDKRFSYEEVQKIIEGKPDDLKDEIRKLNELAQILRKERFKNGSIAFERVEVKFEIDEYGNPLSVFFKEHKEANQLIEEFMLLANKKVAEYIGKKEDKKSVKTFVYRIHDKPNREKLDSFSHFIKKFGYEIKTSSGKQISSSMNKLLSEVRGKKEQNLLENLALRAMAKAEYSTKNIGHYGLNFPYYAHFTSPIRRYPDVMVHRLLHLYINGASSKNKKKIEKQCEHVSDMERRATEAERASIKYKQVEYMMDKIGQVFSGVISGVTEWGLFVELVDSKCEGLVPIAVLDDDFYILDEDNYSLVGRQFNKIYQLGDEVKVEIWRANLLKKQLDFRLV